MLVSIRLRNVLAVAMAACLAVPPAGWAHSRKGDKALKLGRAAEARKDYEQASEYYDQALSQDPSDPAYIMGARRAHFQAAQIHVGAGQRLRKEGQLDAALLEFQKAFTLDPGSAIALQEIRRTTEMIEQQKRGGVAPENKSLTPAEISRKDTLDRISSLQSVPQLKPVSNLPSTLKINNQPPRVLYETVGKLAGINVVFDPSFSPPAKNSNLDLTNATLEEALDYIAMVTRTYWKPVTGNAIFVTEDTATKRNEYADQIVKVIYLQNPTSVQEFQEIVTAVRSTTDIRRMFTYAAQNAVVLRDTVDKVALAEKIFHDLDKPKSEVVVDVIILEANRSRTRDIAAGLTSGGKTGLILPIGFSPRNPVLSGAGSTTTTPSTSTSGTPNTTTSTGGTTAITGTGTGTSTGAISLAQIGKVGLNDFSISLPGALLQAVMSDRSTRVLQSPQVRASDGQKVSLRIGDKIPYATGSFQPGVGSVGVSPLVSTQFNFAEVGVNVDITPHVHGTDEITMHVEIELSDVRDHVDLGGVSQPIIGQRKNATDIRVRDGEVNLLGGLMQNQSSDAVSGIPGFVHVPVLGKFLFGSTDVTKDQGELLIALIPHIVRTPVLTDLDMRGVAAGSDQVVRLSYAPRVLPPAAPATVPAAAPAIQPPTPAASQPGAPGSPLPTTGAPRAFFAPDAVQVQLSAPALVVLQVENVTDLFSAPVKIRWDPKLLRLNNATAGGFLSQDGQQVGAPIDIRNDTGEATINLTRLPTAGGVKGSGPLAVFSFMAVGKGTGKITVTDIGMKTSKQDPITVPFPEIPVTIN